MKTYFGPPIARMLQYRLASKAKVVQIEVLPCAFSENDPRWHQLAKDVSFMSEGIYADVVVGPKPGFRIEKIRTYLEAGEKAYCVTATVAGSLVGFAANKIIEAQDLRIFYISLAIMSAQFQKGQGATTLLAQLFANCFELINDDNIVVAFNTSNPVVLGWMTKYFRDVFPNPQSPQAQPDDEIRQAGQLLARTIFSRAEVDLETFVVKDWHIHLPDIVVRADRVPFYSEAVNRFCAERLRFERQTGDAQMVVGRIFKADLEIFMSLFESQRISNEISGTY